MKRHINTQKRAGCSTWLWILLAIIILGVLVSPKTPPNASIDRSTQPAATVPIIIDTATRRPSSTPAPESTSTPELEIATVTIPMPSATLKSKPTATKAPPAPTVAGGNHTFNGGVVDPPWWPCAKGQIKGNLNSMIYHVPSGRDYARTYDNVRCFDTAAEAQAAGYRPSKR